MAQMGVNKIEDITSDRIVLVIGTEHGRAVYPATNCPSNWLLLDDPYIRRTPPPASSIQVAGIMPFQQLFFLRPPGPIDPSATLYSGAFLNFLCPADDVGV